MIAPPLHVVAAVLRNAEKGILLAQRPPGRDMAGLWEFPGGKVEPGESAADALARELREELGIAIDGSAPLIAVPYAGGQRRLLLEVFEVARFRGDLHGHDGQALAWVAPESLASYPMPPADRPVVAALRSPDRYLITPEPGVDVEAFLDALQTALAEGVRRVQLRAHTITSTVFAVLAARAAELCARHAAELLLNSAGPNAAALASELSCGLHLRASELRIARSRPPGLVALAASCHDATELVAAEALGCDFVVLGPVAPTATHPGAATLGWGGFSALREHTSLPVYALGGLGPADFRSARNHGAQGIAAIRGLWPALRSPRLGGHVV